MRVLEHFEQAGFLEKVKLFSRGEVYSMPEFNSYSMACTKLLLSPVYVIERTAANYSNYTVAPNKLADKGICTYHTHLPQTSKSLPVNINCLLLFRKHVKPGKSEVVKIR